MSSSLRELRSEAGKTRFGRLNLSRRWFVCNGESLGDEGHRSEASERMAGTNQRTLWVMRIISALFLLATGLIHLYLVFTGTGGILGVMFVLNGIAGIVLAIAMVVLRGRLLQLATVLSLLFLIATLGALILALTVSLFGITESWDRPLVPQTFVIEAIGIVVLGVTTAMVLRAAPTPATATT